MSERADRPTGEPDGDPALGDDEPVTVDATEAVDDDTGDATDTDEPTPDEGDEDTAAEADLAATDVDEPDDDSDEADEPDEPDDDSDEPDEPEEADEPEEYDGELEYEDDEELEDDLEPEPAAGVDQQEGEEASGDESGDADGHEGEDAAPAAQVAAGGQRPTRGQRRGAHARKVTPRERLKELIAPQANRTQALIAVACLILGFALSVQAKSTSQDSSFSSLRQSELVALLDRLNNRQDDLRKEVSRLQQEKAALNSDDSQTARKAAQDRQQTLAILAGTEPATGPGIELVISDPNGGVTASDLLNAVQELRDAGAEVLQIGSVRLAVDSHFVDGSDGVLVDGKQLETPYRIKAIGDPHTLSTAMDIPGGVLESLHRAGADGTVTKSQSVAVTAVRKS